MMEFASPWFFLGIPPVLYLIFRKNRKSHLKFSSVTLLKKASKGVKIKHLLGRIFIALAMVFFIVALARPRLKLPLEPSTEDAVDIALVLDVSGSMASVDFEPNRLGVAKETMINFSEKRQSDRLAFVIFAGSAYTKIPLTFDHQMITQSLKEVDTDSVKEEGTAIGMALSVGVNRLKKSEAKSKVIILVTDGDNNAGAINPTTASDLAKELGIKVYTIGVGTDETILPVQYFGKTRYQTYEGGLNEPLLQSIATTTGGSYYRARDGESLEGIFDEIDKLETTDFERDERQSYEEWAFNFIKVGLVVFMFGLYLDRYRYMRVPN